MNKEKKELAVQAAKDLALSIKGEKTDEGTKDVLISIIGNTNGEMKGAIAGSPKELIYALIVMAKEQPEVKHIIQTVADFLKKDENPIEGLLSELVKLPGIEKLRKVVGDSCPCPSCVARREMEKVANNSNPIKPTDIN